VRGGLLNPDSTRLAPNAPLEIAGWAPLASEASNSIGCWL